MIIKRRGGLAGLSLGLLVPLFLLGGCASGLPADGPGDGGDGPGDAAKTELGTPAQTESFQTLYDAAKKAGQDQVIVYGPPPAKDVTDAFEARFPGIRVIFQQLQSAERISKLEQEKQTGNFVADVATDGATPMVSMGIDGWCQQFDPIMDIPSEWVGEKKNTFFSNVSIFGMVINTDLISAADAPRGWRDLASSKYKGKVVMVNPSAGGAAAFSFARMLYPKDNETKYAGILEGLRENASLVAKDALTLQEVASGNYAIGALAYYPYYLETKAQGAPIEFIFPFTEGGGNIWTKSGSCLINNAPHPEAGQLWINWLFSEQGQEVLRAQGSYPTMPGHSGPGEMPPLDKVDLMYIVPDSEAITAYGPYIKEVIKMFSH
jgi:iron(III) transport system substrate-binding protein